MGRCQSLRTSSCSISAWKNPADGYTGARKIMIIAKELGLSKVFFHTQELQHVTTRFHDIDCHSMVSALGPQG